MAATKEKETKNQRRRALKKARKQEVSSSRMVRVCSRLNFKQAAQTPANESQAREKTPEASEKTVPSGPSLSIDISDDDPLFDQFKEIIEKFQESAQDESAKEEVEKPEIYYGEDDDIPDEDDEQKRK